MSLEIFRAKCGKVGDPGSIFAENQVGTWTSVERLRGIFDRASLLKHIMKLRVTTENAILTMKFDEGRENGACLCLRRLRLCGA
jgi:hypothetical protein